MLVVWLVKDGVLVFGANCDGRHDRGDLDLKFWIILLDLYLSHPPDDPKKNRDLVKIRRK